VDGKYRQQGSSMIGRRLLKISFSIALQQLRHVDRDPPRFVAGEWLGC
jgi:hypothetical protein